MKKTFTILIAAIAAILMMAQPEMAVGQEKGFTQAYQFKTAQSSGNTAYGSNYNITVSSISWSCPGNQNFSGYVRIGGKEISNQDREIYSQAPLNTLSPYNVTKITVNHNGVSNSNLTVNSVKIIVASNSDFSTVVETKTLYPTFSVSTTSSFDFTPGEGKTWTSQHYYRFVFNVTNSKSSNYGVDVKDITFYKTTYTITYNANEATGGTAPSATIADAGSNATVASNTGTLVRTGYNFSGWNTADDGSGTDYAEGATINSIAQDYTLYAKWTSASSPNIVVSGSGISNNALNLAYTAAENQTATASFNNMTGYSSPTVTLYDNLACSESFSGNWFNASLDGSTITYSASANSGAARTVYMRVSAVYNEITYYSNVITVTQAALPCTVTYNKNNDGASGSMSDGSSPYAYGSTVTVLANGFTAPTGKHFYKWNTANDGSGTYYEKDDTFTITGNVILYAQWEDNPIYVHITSLSQIIPGAHYILARGITKDATTQVMDGKQSDYRDAKTTTTNVQKGDVDGDGNDDIYIQESGLYEFIISGYETVTISSVDYNSYTIYDKDNTGYLNNGLGLNTSTLDDQSKWILEFDASNKIKIRNVNSTGNYMQFNKTLARVKTYTNTQDNGYLYIKYNDKDCEIYSASTLSQNESYTNLKIVKGNYVNGSVTVPNNKILTVTNTLTNQGTAANLVIEDGGQLITANSVSATVEKTITKPESWSNNDNTGWYAISSPVGNIAPGDVTNMTPAPVNDIPQYDLYKYVENMGWYNSQHSEQSISSLEKGHGYLYARSATATLSFAGSVVSNDFDLTGLTKSSVKHSGLHLIGNPYTHTIYYGVAIDGDISDAGYYKLNSTGSWISTAAGTAIDPMEAIFVFVTKNDATVNFINDASAPASKANHDYIQFTVANNQYEDVAYAMFDKGNGLAKIEHRNSEAPMIYIPQNDDNYAIAMMNDNTQMFGLNFKAATTGKYTLSYNTKGGFDYLHLIDRLTGEDIDMLIDNEYSFIGSPIDGDNRFIVKLTYNSGNVDSNNDIFAYQSGSDIIVNGEGELQIFDITGRRVMTTTINGVETINVLSQGVYIFRLNEKVQKIVVR